MIAAGFPAGGSRQRRINPDFSPTCLLPPGTGVSRLTLTRPRNAAARRLIVRGGGAQKSSAPGGERVGGGFVWPVG